MATNLTKQIVLFSFGPNVSQDLGYNTEANTTLGLLASAFFCDWNSGLQILSEKKYHIPLM